MRDKKIRDKINAAMIPETSFSEFCAKNKIERHIDAEAKIKKKRHTTFAKIFYPMVSAVLVLLVIVLPLQLTKRPNVPSQDTPEPKTYGELAVDKIFIDTDQFINSVDVLLFNMENVGNIAEVNRMSPKENRELLLGYHIKNVLYGFSIENDFVIFEFDYLIRSYKNYNFLQKELFDNPDKKVNIDDRNFEYRIQAGIDGIIAYIRFAEDGIEYFINLKALNETIEIDDASVKIFLQNLFTKEEVHEEIDIQSE